MAGVIDGFRWAITGRDQPPGLILLVSAAVLLVFLGGLFFFNRMETVCGANPLGTDTILVLHAELSGHFQRLLVVLPQQPGVLVTGIPSPGRHF